MNILITSGGATELIDGVRGITNFSRDRLGAKIADEFAKCDVVDKVYYVCARSSALPTQHLDKIEIIKFTDVAGIQNITYGLLKDEQIDVIIHAAAINDYRTVEVLDADDNVLDRSGKINSDHETLTVKLGLTPKVIGKFKEISPDSRLVGFKLLTDPPIQKLFDAADKTLHDNDCEFVLANRLEDVDGENHIAYLRDANGTVAEFKTKTDIAKGLVEHLKISTKPSRPTATCLICADIDAHEECSKVRRLTNQGYKIHTIMSKSATKLIDPLQIKYLTGQDVEIVENHILDDVDIDQDTIIKPKDGAKSVLLGITSSVATYKACELAKELVKRGHIVDVMMSKNATNLIKPRTFELITGRKVHVELFGDFTPDEKIEHISLAQRADVVIIAPATMRVISDIATSRASDLVTTTFLAVPKKTPKFIAPAMNTEMYKSKANKRNLKQVKKDGVRIIKPVNKMLACNVKGIGALASINTILKQIERKL